MTVLDIMLSEVSFTEVQVDCILFTKYFDLFLTNQLPFTSSIHVVRFVYKPEPVITHLTSLMSFKLKVSN